LGLKGFTLAEVLITLAIIGVVAAITVPTLMVEINNKQWTTAANVFERKLNEALKNMNTSQVISGHTTTLSFVEELSEHFKINKICKNNELQSCFSDTVYWGAGDATPEEVDMRTVTNSSHFGLKDWGTELIGVQFANGVTGIVAYNPECWGDPLSNQFNGTSCVSVLYDVSGNKKPNTKGKDIGNFGVMRRLGDASCAFKIDGGCYSAPFIAPAATIEECKEVLANTAFAGICRLGQDYWAGAIKTCGGIDKMPSTDQLEEIGKSLYSNIGPKNAGRFDCPTDAEGNLTECIQPDKVADLGFVAASNGKFAIYSNTLTYQQPPYVAGAYAFTSTSFSGAVAPRNNATAYSIYTVCSLD